MGSAAQQKAMKQVAGKIKLDLAQYREMADFAKFSSDLDVSTKALLARGERLTELLKQNVYNPMSLAQEVVIIFAAIRGYLDKIDVANIKDFEKKAIEELQANHSQILDAITSQGEIKEDTEELLKSFYDNFVATYIQNSLKG